MLGYFKRRRRNRLRASPLPASWLQIIRRNVPMYGRLTIEDQKELEGHIQVFLAEKRFEGCGGFELTEEVRVTIAAGACVLLLHRKTDYFRRLITILVYPAPYLANSVEPIGAGVVLEEEQTRLGEAWKSGVVVVSWADLQATGAASIRAATSSSTSLHISLTWRTALRMEHPCSNDAASIPVGPLFSGRNMNA